MGKQVNFFMTFEDECAFIGWVKAKTDCILIREVAKNGQVSRIESLVPVADEPSLESALLVRVVDLEDVQMELIPTLKIYSVDALNSPVIQWTRPMMMSNWLASGRLWFEERSNQGKKSEGFRRWANSLLRWLRRNYVPLDDRPYLVGPMAERMAAAGKLKLGPPMEGIDHDVAQKILGLKGSLKN